MKQALKQGVRSALGRIGPPVWSMRRQPRLLVLMYHRVLPARQAEQLREQPGMSVTPETFAQNVATLQQHFELVHLDDWVRVVRSGVRVPRRACAITFDDGWHDNLEFAWPTLQRRSAPATIFLVSDYVGGHYRFWPNRLAQLLSLAPSRLREGLPPGLLRILDESGALSHDAAGEPQDTRRDRAIGACKQLTDEQLDAMLDEAERALGVSQSQSARELLDWDEIAELRASGLVRFGSHTRRHRRLRDELPAQQLSDEIVQSRAQIEQRLGAAPSLFCYPNGEHCPGALDIVRAHYDAAVTTRAGWNAPGSDMHLLSRVGLHEDVARTPAAMLGHIVATTRTL